MKIIIALLLCFALSYYLVAEDTPKVVLVIIESVTPNVEKAKSELGKKIRLENDKLLAQLKGLLELKTKAKNFEEANIIKDALEKAIKGDYMDELVNDPYSFSLYPIYIFESIENIRPRVDIAKAEYDKKIQIENEKIISQIKRSLEISTKAGKFDDAVALKAALEKAENRFYLNEMLYTSIDELLNGGEISNADDVAIFTKRRMATSGWKTQGEILFVKDPEMRGQEILSLKNSCLFKDNYDAIKNGPVFIGMWVKYERGSVGSIFGIAQENRDELSLIVLEGGKIGTFTGWPNAGIVNSKASLKPGAWVYLACQWDKMGMTIYIDGKEADKVPVPALDNRLGRLEIGVNSPGGDEYITMMVGSFRMMTGKLVSPNLIPKYMFSDKQKIAK